MTAEPKIYCGRQLGVFTSGGDSQGMNSAIRAVTRMGLYLGCKVYFIHEGYQGMVDGGEGVQEVDWNSVSDIIQKGGTIMGSARCQDFRERKGRLKACENLLKHNITNLVCIGGDGSLTGAYTFRLEWPGLVRELVDNGRVSSSKIEECPCINIVGLVGSIDNDFCGTDMTIGTDSALHRIVEAVDAVEVTAQSHQRAFVIEVMGRHCGYLALVAALATEADWVFIPEWPPASNWADLMCQKMQNERDLGQRINIIIVSEGAIDRDGKKITSDNVKDVIKKRLKYDTRVTVLGHVQRGGIPTAYDRLLGCRMGAEAVIALMEMKIESDPCVISIESNQIVRVPLMQCVERTKLVQKAMDEKNWERAVKLRGTSFQHNLETYKLLNTLKPTTEKASDSFYNLAVMNVGAPASGMNAAVRAFVRLGIANRCRVYGIYHSFEGLINGEIEELQWTDVSGWIFEGGSNLGTSKELPTDLAKIAEQLRTNEIAALLIIGGFEAFHSALVLQRSRTKYDEFCIPICVIPCTISNNVPGTAFSIGSDTALNEICCLIDKIKQSATGTNRRVFIIETMGGHCGYLATVSALASGADNAYIFEESFNVSDMLEDIKVIAKKMSKGVQRYLIIRSELANANYTTQFIGQLFKEEGKDLFETRVNELSHSQQGGSPSPYDRTLGTKLAARSLEWLLKNIKSNQRKDGSIFTNDVKTVSVVGLIERTIGFTPVETLGKETDFKHRLPKAQWWLKLRPLLRILAKHDSNYEASAMDVNPEEVS